MSPEAFNRAVGVLTRWFAAAILCFFASVPGWILFHAAGDAIADPKTIDRRWLVAVVVCAALVYFQLLLAYRAFTGRGRRQDGGLLPPLAIQGFAVLFAALGASVSAIGLRNGQFWAVLGGLVEFLAGVAVFRMAGLRRKLGQTKPGAH